MFRLYFILIASRIRSQLQYRVSVLAELAATTLVTGLEFGVLVILLARFGGVAGWSLAETALLYGLTSLAFSFAEMGARGFDSPFERMIQQGAFDGVLARPLSPFFQVITSEFQLRRLGRSAQALFVLAYAFDNLPIVWTADRLLLVPLTVASGTAIYVALIVIGATVTFWTIKTPEVINAFTFGGEQATRVPLSIYNELLRSLLLFIIPVGFANYPAALYLLGRSDPGGLPAWTAWLAPGAAALFCAAALRFWAYGVSKYTSTGS